ncbi:MAG: cupredoxin domain-containing protein [Armatimonadota bacterium]
MRHRSVLVGLLLVVITLGMATRVPAQSQVRRVIEVTLSEFKFEPNQITFNEGETVVIRLRNAGPRFPHNIASRYWNNIPLTVRGDARQAVEEERKLVQLDAGKSAEVEFVAQGRGSAAIICSVFIHATVGMTGAFFIAPAPR